MLEDNKERIKKRFSLLREHLSMNLRTIEYYLEERLPVKTYFGKFIYFDLNVIEIASYGLCILIKIPKGVKDLWEKE